MPVWLAFDLISITYLILALAHPVVRDPLLEGAITISMSQLPTRTQAQRQTSLSSSTISSAPTSPTVSDTILTLRNNTEIHCYSFSVPGEHVATLSFTVDKVEVKLWNVNALTRHQGKQPIARGSLSLEVAVSESRQHSRLDLRVSVSWDGSQVVVFSAGPNSEERESFWLLNHENSTLISLDKRKQQDVHKDLQSFIGHAKFVNTEQDERFISCDGEFVSVYTTKESWQQVYSIQLMAPPDERLLLARFAIESARGEYFLWHKGWNVSVWHLKLGSMASCISLGLGFMEKDESDERDEKKYLTLEDMKAAPPAKVEFLYSNHDTIALRVVVDRSINVDMAMLFSAESGQELGSMSLSDLSGSEPGATTLDNVLKKFDLYTNGCTLRMPALPGSNIDNIMSAFMKESHHQYGIYQQSPNSPTFIASKQGSALEIRRMGISTPVEHQGCVPSCKPTKLLLSIDGNRKTVEAPGRPPVVVAIRTDTMKDKPFLEVDLRPIGDDQRNVLRMEMEGSEYVNLFPKLWIVTIQGPDHLSIWELPATMNGQCELLLHWVGFPPGSFTSGELSVEIQCDNKQEIEYRNKKYNDGRPLLISLKDPRVCSKDNAKLFVGGVKDIADAFTKSGESTFKEAIIRYLGKYINAVPVPGDDSTSTMFVLCYRIHDNINLQAPNSNSSGIKDIITKLLDEHGEWVPQEKYTKGHNPLDVVFKKRKRDDKHDKEEQNILHIAEKIVQWCHSKSKGEKPDNRNDFRFIHILLECMPSILRISRRRPGLVVIADEIIQKCYDQAQIQNRPDNLNYLVKCMPELQALYPVIALKVTRWFAYVPARDRQVIIDNHTISNPPFLSKFFSSEPLQLYDCRNPTLQFRHDPNVPDKDRDYFREDVYIAPFSLLWSIKEFDNSDKISNEINSMTTAEVAIAEITSRGPSSTSILEFGRTDKAPAASESKTKRKMNYDRDFIMVRMSRETSWWKSLLLLIPSQIIPLQHIYVRPRYYRLEILDNPAIEALVEYKWNTIGYLLWLVRFSTQCVYYLLIVIAAFIQVYVEEPQVMYYVFVAIIVLAGWFLIQEARQLVQSIKEVLQIRSSKIFSKRRWYRRPYTPRYLKSQYNWLDLLAFIFPLIASKIQLDNINEGVHDRAGWLLSFSLIIVFLHMVAELRVIRVVCKYVTIVLRIFSEIKVFMAVFASGILFFSLAIEHILRGHSVGPNPVAKNATDSNSTDSDEIEFPKPFLGAITSTFFIMGGRYDPVNTDLSEDKNIGLHMMILIYFFFTVILMLNVLIALINGGFDKADSDWHLVWLENRLRYVESAENMSYRIPGFRKTYDWFPREIYYTATEEQVKKYKSRMPKVEENSGSYESTVDDTRRRRVSDLESETLTQNQIKEQLSAFQKQMDDQIVKRLEEFLNRVPRNTFMSSPISARTTIPMLEAYCKHAVST
ncbi:hypothetical protein CPC16_002165 [Podila verticillata]|nr:hypothetical protein CPC16_002165 [Podila verticillata]